jgi:competence protein ComEC
VTHPDEDHTGGAAAVIENLEVGALVFGGASAGRAELAPLRLLARRRGVVEYPVDAGSELAAGDIAVRVLWPPAGWTGAYNDASLVAALAVGTVRVLVCGDLEAAGERNC